MEPINILMVTHRRPEYLRLSLPRLLESVDSRTRVWLWHNGDDEETRAIAESYSSHPAVTEYHHEPENVGLRQPVNWILENSVDGFVSKVDDDCLVARDWLYLLRRAHQAPEAGVIGSWRFYDEDFQSKLAFPKLRSLSGGSQILQNHWVQGSGFVAKRSVVKALGPIRPKEWFPDWFIRGARIGFVNGWHYPFIHEEHMDDPRSPYTQYVDEASYSKLMPLSSVTMGAKNLKQWTELNRKSAYQVQKASLDIKRYVGWRRQRTRIARRLSRALTGRILF